LLPEVIISPRAALTPEFMRDVAQDTRSKSASISVSLAATKSLSAVVFHAPEAAAVYAVFILIP